MCKNLFEERMKEFEKNIESEVKNITAWISDYVKSAKANGVILGMSGGLDCSVVARLVQLAGIPVKLILMPNGNSMNLAGDGKDAMVLIDKFNFDYMECPITSINKELVYTINANKDSDITLSDMALSNINPRLRMTILYTLGQSLNYLVAGTGNLSEITMGYFTKWGDGGSDFNPLAEFTKSEVRIIAKAIGIPDRIIDKAPSANLWEGQTDEKEMGVTYYDLDRFILTMEGTKETFDIVEGAISKNRHKVLPIATYKRK